MAASTEHGERGRPQAEWLASLYENIRENIGSIENDVLHGKYPTFHLDQFKGLMQKCLRGDFKQLVTHQFFLEHALPTVTRAFLIRSYPDKRLVPVVQEYLQRVLDLIIQTLRSTKFITCEGLLQTLYRIFHVERRFYLTNKTERALKLDEEIKEDWIRPSKSTGYLFAQNINYFGHYNGFDILFGRIRSRDLPMTMKEVVLHLEPLAIARYYFDEGFFATIVGDLKDEVFGRITRMTEAEIKMTEKQHIVSVIIRIKDLLQVVLSETQAAQVSESFELEMAHKLLTSATLPKRIDAIVHINQMERTHQREHMLKHSIDTDDYDSPAEWMNYRYLGNWLLDNKILDKLYGETSHVQLASRGDEILKFLAQINALSTEHLGLLWNHTKGKHEAEVASIYSTIARISSQLNERHLRYLFGRLKDVPFKQVGHLELKLVHDLTRYSDFKASTRVASLGLEYLWQVVQDENKANPALVMQAVDRMINLLQKSRSGDLRIPYLTCCMANIKNQKSVLQSLRISEGILRILTSKQSIEYTYSVIDELERRYQILNSSLKDLQRCCAVAYKIISRTRKNEKKQQLATNAGVSGGPILENLDGSEKKKGELGRPSPCKAKSEDNLLLGSKYEHKLELKHRLEFLAYILTNSSLKLKQEQVELVWDSIITKAVNQHQRDRCLNWIRNLNARSAFTPKALAALFHSIGKSLDFRNLSKPGLACFRDFFLLVNEVEGNIEIDQKSDGGTFHVLTTKSLEGVDLLWEICLTTKSTSIFKEACSFLISVHQRLAPSLMIQLASTREGFVAKCMQSLRKAALALGLEKLKDQKSVTSESIKKSQPLSPSPKPIPKTSEVDNVASTGMKENVNGMQKGGRGGYGGDTKGNCDAILRCLQLLDQFREECKDIPAPPSKKPANLCPSSNPLSLQSPRLLDISDPNLASKLSQISNLPKPIGKTDVLTSNSNGNSGIDGVSTEGRGGGKEGKGGDGKGKADSIEKEPVMTIHVVYAVEDTKGQQQPMRTEVEVVSGAPVKQLRDKIFLALKIPEEENELIQIKTSDNEVLSDSGVLDPLVFERLEYVSVVRPEIPAPPLTKQTSLERLKMKPSFIISNHQSYFDLLFDLLGLHKVCPSAPESALSTITTRVWKLLTLLPTNQRLLQGLRNFSIENKEVEGSVFWSYFLDTDSPAKLLYSLRIIQRLMKPNLHSRDKMVASRLWRKRMVAHGGFDYILRLLDSELKFFTNAKMGCVPQQLQMHRGCLGLLLQIVNFFVVTGLASFSKSFHQYIIRVLGSPDDHKRQIKSDDVEDIVQQLCGGIDSGYLTVFEPHLYISRLIDVVLENVKFRSTEEAGGETSVVRPALLLCLVSSLLASPKVMQIVHQRLNDLVIGGLMENHHKLFRKHVKSMLLELYYSSEAKIQSPPVLTDRKHDHKNSKKDNTPKKNLHDVLFKLLVQTVPMTGEYPHTSDCFFDMLQTMLKRKIYHYHGDSKEVVKRFGKLFTGMQKMLQDYKSIERSESDIDHTLSGLLTTSLHLVSVEIKHKSGSVHYPFKENSQQMLDILLNILFKLPSNSSGSHNPDPQAKSHRSRTAAFDLLVAYAHQHIANYRYVVDKTLLQMDHNSIRFRQDAWMYSWTENCKSSAGYVGLVNLGCICYMNSLLQQLHMLPEFRRQVLSLECKKKEKQESFLYQLQTVFGNLQESQQMCFNPYGFVHAFKDYDGNPTNPNIQQDVNEFFNLFCQRLEDCCGQVSKDLVMKTFGGVLEQQIIIKGANNRYRDEPFYALSLEVKGKRFITESLDMYVQGEKLTGKNQFKSEELGRKVDALKRVVIKKLPNLLILHLKRFEFNFDDMKKVKLNDYCSFEEELNIQKYTKDYLDAKQEAESTTQKKPKGYYDYKLHGLLIHTGSADAGHYFSYIKERKPIKGQTCRWLEFNDTVVKPFDSKTIPAKSFGGTQTSTQRTKTGRTVTRKIPRAANAYLLFYERVYREPEVSKGPMSPSSPKTPTSMKKTHERPLPPDSPKPYEDIRLRVDVSPPESKSHSKDSDGKGKQMPEPPKVKPMDEEELAAESSPIIKVKGLERKREKKHFGTMPPKIYDQVFHSNMCFLRNRYLFDDDFYAFVANILKVGDTYIKNKQIAKITSLVDPSTCADHLHSIKLTTRYVLEKGREPSSLGKRAVFVLVRRKKNTVLDSWMAYLKYLCAQNIPGSHWILEGLANDPISLRMLVLECHVTHARRSVCDLFSYLFTILAQHERPLYNEQMELKDSQNPKKKMYIPQSVVLRIVRHLQGFLYQDHVSRCWRNLEQYFHLLLNFARLGKSERNFLMENSLLWRLVDFFLGNDSPYAQQRRWEMGDEYSDPQLEHMWELLAVLACTVRTGGTEIPPTQIDEPRELHQEARNILLDIRFLNRIIAQAQNTEATIRLFKHWTWENAPVNKWFCSIFQKVVCDTNYDACDPLYTLLDAVLQIKDSLQEERVAMYLNSSDGLMEKAYRFRRDYPLFTYLCIKKLMELAAMSDTAAGRYLAENKRDLQWVESWLPSHIENSMDDSHAKNDMTLDRQVSAMEMLESVKAFLLGEEDDMALDETASEEPTNPPMSAGSEGEGVNGLTQNPDTKTSTV